MHPKIVHEPDADHPGWLSWNPRDGEGFNVVLGHFLTRPDGPGRGRCRFVPDDRHLNFQGVVHGGVLATFVDIAMFAGGTMAGVDLAYSVTLDLSLQFLGRAAPAVPVETSVEVMRETGRLLFLRGAVEQEGETIAAWSGILRKPGRRP